jgi:hypothetical protein
MVARTLIALLALSLTPRASASETWPCVRRAKPVPLLNELERLYPKQPRAELVDRIKRVVVHKLPALKLLRSFVPLYYDRLHELSCEMPSFKDVWKLSGWCAGDAHLENYGAYINPSDDSTTFMIVDIDDAGPCPLFADALRFFASVRLHGDSMDGLVQAYRDGMEGKEHTVSPGVRKVMLKSLERAMTSKPGFLPEKDRKGHPDVRELSQDERALVATAVTSVYPKGSSLIDAYEFEREKGGSAGLKRYEALVKYPGMDKPMWIEFKELSTPGIFPLKSGPLLTARKRAFKTWWTERGEEPPPEYQVARVKGHDFMLRPRWAGNKNARLKHFDEDQEAGMFVDEAYALGEFHSRTDAGGRYRRAVSRIPPEEWLKAADRVKADFERLLLSAEQVVH